MKIVIKNIIVLSIMSTLVLGSKMFTREGDIVFDNDTKLYWQDDRRAATTKLKQYEAIQHCGRLNLGGYDDWRLPNIRELLSIVDRSTLDPAMKDIFEHVHSKKFKLFSFNEYVSSTGSTLSIESGQGNGYNPWGVSFYDGSAFVMYPSKYFVRCVRGGKK